MNFISSVFAHNFANKTSKTFNVNKNSYSMVIFLKKIEMNWQNLRYIINYLFILVVEM